MERIAKNHFIKQKFNKKNLFNNNININSSFLIYLEFAIKEIISNGNFG